TSMLFEDQEADRVNPAPAHEFSGDRAPNDTGADDTDIIRIHRILFRSMERSFRKSPAVSQCLRSGALPWFPPYRINTARFFSSSAEAGARPSSKQPPPQNSSVPDWSPPIS